MGRVDIPIHYKFISIGRRASIHYKYISHMGIILAVYTLQNYKYRMVSIYILISVHYKCKSYGQRASKLYKYI